MFGGVGVPEFIFLLMMLALVWPLSRVWSKAGHSPWLGLLALIPPFGLIGGVFSLHFQRLYQVETGVPEFLVLSTLLATVLLLCRTCSEAGYSPWWGALALVPPFPPLGYIGMVLFLTFAKWPSKTVPTAKDKLLSTWNKRSSEDATKKVAPTRTVPETSSREDKHTDGTSTVADGPEHLESP